MAKLYLVKVPNIAAGLLETKIDHAQRDKKTRFFCLVSPCVNRSPPNLASE